MVEPEEAGYHQEFEVEGIPLLHQGGQNHLEDVAPDQLDAGLGVADVEMEKEPDQLLVAP